MTSELDRLGAGVVEVGGSFELFYKRQRKRLMSLAYVVSVAGQVPKTSPRRHWWLGDRQLFDELDDQAIPFEIKG